MKYRTKTQTNKTVQLLWHQLRVSVLVLKERLLQGLQDSNGNYTRQSDILQAFSQDRHQTRLDALTEVDACGQLTIRCSQDYFSLDCGITAFELSDYSPGDEAEGGGAQEEGEGPAASNSSPQLADNLNRSPPAVPTMQCGPPGPSESGKRRPSTAGASPTQPSQPKRAAVWGGEQSPPPPVAPPDCSAFWLELDSVYPESLFFSSDPEASGEESDPPPAPGKAAVWIVRHQGQKAAPASSTSSPDREPWSGSEEFLALPPQLRRTEQLALKLESLAQSAPPRPGDCDSQDALQDVDDWDLTDWDDVPSLLPPLPPYRRNLLSRFSSASSSDFALSLDESIESGPLSDLQSEDEEGRGSAHRRPWLPAPPVDGRGGACSVQRLLEDIQSQDNDPNIWKKIEGFVQQLDGFISWLQEALESTDNWTQPRQDVDSLRAYLDTHLSFKLSVEGRGALKESLMEEGRALLAIISSHQAGLKEILHMVSSQWDQLQRQIRRQHGWMLRALRCIQARLLCAGQSQEPLTAPGGAPANQQASPPPDGLEPELIPGQCEALAEQMAARLSGLHDPPSASRRLCSQLGRNDSLQEFEAEYQELWDWLMDMDAMVTDSHQLMMSEEQRHHLFKSSHAELVAMETRRTGLLGRAESLKRSGAELPSNFHRNVHNLTHTWRQLEKILSHHSAPGSASFRQSASASAVPEEAGPRSALSPLTNSLLEQLEARIKELKAWLRDTELLIFNSCLGRDKEASEQLASFKSLCSEVRARRRGVASVLKLCQKLLQQSQSGPMAEVGPEAEQHRKALQLLSINLERRWEAIVMQALQWQNRLRRQLGETQVPGGALEPGLVDLHQISPVPVGPVDDSWEWDETDMTPAEPNTTGGGGSTTTSSSQEEARPDPILLPRSGSNVYQVYSLHTVELYSQPPLPPRASSSGPKSGVRKQQQLLLKSASKDSSFSSMESLPDLLGGATSGIGRGGVAGQREGESGRGSGQSAGGRRSESESGIVSDTGSKGEEEDEDEEEEEGEESKLDTLVGTYVVLHAVTEYNHASKNQENIKEKGKRRDESRRNREEEKRRRNRKGGGEVVEVLINGREILTPADVDSSKTSPTRSDFKEVRAEPAPPALRSQANSPVFSQGSSLESLLALGLDLFPPKEQLHRSASLESCLIPGRSAGETRDGPSSLGDLELGRSPGPEGGAAGEEGEPSCEELSRRTLDLLKRLEDIQSPLGEKMTRSVSDMTLRSGFLPRGGITSSPSLGARRLPLSGMLSSSRRGPPSLVNESSATPSLTELSSNEDSSLGSEDFATLQSQRRRLNLLLPDRAASPNSNAGSCGRRCHRNGPGARGIDEADAASLSLLVNVSCSSACTDDEDSDLLSSSTLTLTEEELGVRDGEEEHGERLSSSGDDEDEEEMEGSYVLGLEYMKRELQSWIRFPRASSSKTEAVLRDELQCGTNPPSAFTCSSHRFSNHTKPTEANGQTQRDQEEEEENRRNAARSLIRHYVDDVENGNAEQSGSPTKDEDDELLREEASVFAKKGGAPSGSYVFKTAELAQESNSPSELLPFFTKCASSLVGQLRGELACHSSSLPSPPSLSPLEDSRSHDALRGGGRKAITSEEKFKFSSFVKEETRSQIRDSKSSLPPKKRHSSHASCCGRLASPSSASSASPPPSAVEQKENVHDFVLEIIDMTSLALKNKETPPEEPDRAQLHPLSHIREKVLQHSHRPLHLKKGDFYSYLSLSSHDSDCGEVSRCSEDGSSSPPPYGGPSPEVQGVPAASPPLSPDIRDEETLFAACTEEVYLGPPLCYSMSLPTKPRGPLQALSPSVLAFEPGTGPAPPSPSGGFLLPPPLIAPLSFPAASLQLALRPPPVPRLHPSLPSHCPPSLVLRRRAGGAG
ncbi:A-kinase anchor protein 6 [Spinachia spinachia]